MSEAPRTAVMANASSALAVSHLHVAKGDSVRVDDVSLEVKPLEIHGLVGPSGSGKTTILEAIAGVWPASGDVRIGSVPLDRDARRPFVHLAPHLDTAFAHDRVRAVLALARRALGADASTVDTLVARLELGPHLDERCGWLPRGARKRVQLAVALLVPRGALLLDEPFDGLDLRQLRTVTALLRTSTNEHRSLLVALASTSAAEALCDRYTLVASRPGGGARVVGAGQIHELRALARTHPGASLEEVLHALA